MHTLLKIALGLLVALLILLVALPLIGLWTFGPDLLGQTTVTIDGETLALPEVGAAGWAVGGLVALVVGFVLAVVVPGALLTALLFAACGILFAALLVGGLLALVLAPLVLPILLAWWLLRRRRTMPA